MKRAGLLLLCLAVFAACSSAPPPKPAPPQVTLAGEPMIIAGGLRITARFEPVPPPAADALRFQQTAQAPITTFAVDAGGTSYASIRRAIEAGLTPQPEGVRVEELINAFPYTYPQPENGDALSITTEIAACPWNPRNRLLRVGLHAGAMARNVGVELEFDPKKISTYRQIGSETRSPKHDESPRSRDLGAGRSVTALYELEPVRGTRGKVAEVRVSYEDGITPRQLVSTAEDAWKSQWDASPDFQFAAAVAELGMILHGSKHLGSASYDEVLQLARIARGPDPDGLRGELIALAQKGKEIGDSWLRAAST